MSIETTEATLDALAEAVAKQRAPEAFAGTFRMTPRLEAAIGRIMAADAKAHRKAVDQHFGNTGRWMTDNRHGDGRKPDRSAERAAKVARVIEMRNGGATFVEIGAALGITNVTAANMFKAAGDKPAPVQRRALGGEYDHAAFPAFAEATITRIIAETGADRGEALAPGKAGPDAIAARQAIAIALHRGGASTAQIGSVMNRTRPVAQNMLRRALDSQGRTA